jgi:hypothetical protein
MSAYYDYSLYTGTHLYRLRTEKQFLITLSRLFNTTSQLILARRLYTPVSHERFILDLSVNTRTANYTNHLRTCRMQTNRVPVNSTDDRSKYGIVYVSNAMVVQDSTETTARWTTAIHLL